MKTHTVATKVKGEVVGEVITTDEWNEEEKQTGHTNGKIMAVATDTVGTVATTVSNSTKERR